ncbi:LOW QUALITY PROTEIN: alpha-N-acetylneuraminate alpha-2,8-sialyltransferase ST8SIA3 [Lampetra fluviatilis]
MTRGGPCVLGVMVLSAALFALSLVSYVRVKTPGGALRRGGGGGGLGGGARRGGLGGAGGGPHRGRGSRLYALHPGFRPHMSLGPWEAPHARRPRPWEHNPHAVQQLREELSHYVDAVRGFSLTRGDVSEGQLLHFTYSPPRYVYPASQALRSLLPLAPPLQACGRLPSCAVVGSSGLLRGSGCGREIDAHTFVIRCNFAPTGGSHYGPDVGNLTNLTTFNPSILETAYGGLLTEPDRARFRSRLAALGHALLWVPAFLFHTSAHVTRALTDFFLEPGHSEMRVNDGEQQQQQQGDDGADGGHNHSDSDVIRVRLAWPGDIVTNITRFWRTKGLSPKRLSTGLLMASLCASLCDRTDLYGFWPFAWDPRTGGPIPYHYYDAPGAKFSTRWQESHQLPLEFQLLRSLHAHGALRLRLEACAQPPAARGGGS